MKRINLCVSLILFLMVLSTTHLIAAKDGEWKTWRDKIRGKNGILKIKYLISENKEFKFEVYKNKDWEGNDNSWEKIDDFVITRRKPSHSETFNEFYKSVIGNIKVHYKIVADFDKNKVRSSGYIISPIPKTFPVRTEKNSWNQDFFKIPDSGLIVTSKKDGYEYFEVSDIWAGICSGIACGPWVQFQGYSETHRFNAHIPKVGPVIIQLWKGFCPNLGETSKDYNFENLVNLINLGEKFPGGIGAEVGVYRPIVPKGTKADIRHLMFLAATTETPLGSGEWEPLVDPNLKISFQLINPDNNKVLVDAEEKNSWWRTKWISAHSFEEYKQKHDVPEGLKQFDCTKHLFKFTPPGVLKYELHYTINGVKQVPWKDDSFTGRYPEIGFNGIWRDTDESGSPRFIEVYNNGREIDLRFSPAWSDYITVPLNGGFVKSSDGRFEVKAVISEANDRKLSLEFVYKPDEFEKVKAALNVPGIELKHTIELILSPINDLEFRQGGFSRAYRPI